MLKNQRFTIGEMAKMHCIPQSTLRYYDEKEIFQPSKVDPDTHYRYYTTDQFPLINSIMFLRHLGVPLHEIKQYTDQRTPTVALGLLQKQKDLVLQKQKELEYVLSKINHHIDIIRNTSQASSAEVVFRTLPQRAMLSVEVVNPATDEMFEYYILSLQENLRNSLSFPNVALFSGNIGVTIAKESILANNYQEFRRVFYFLDTITEPIPRSEFIEAGLYACIQHHGSYLDTHKSYAILHQAIQAHGFDIQGDSIELGLIDLSMTENEDEFVTEIQIPVQKR
ncbi:MerR family transcriptional regulator [Paenibacillus sp. GCM10027629]|uniref:MerR family transcriptional regulator n=1 Tax=Paenibacillus sp. GCM10027629 TaxID=3273414 RepID=UPI0036292C00